MRLIRLRPGMLLWASLLPTWMRGLSCRLPLKKLSLPEGLRV